MKLYSRNILISKPYGDVCNIIQSSKYRLSKGRFTAETFSIYCAKRFNGGILSLFPIKGTLTPHDGLIAVTLELHANFIFFIGCAISFLGILHLIQCLIWHFARWIPGVGMVVLGLLLVTRYLFEGIEFVHRLQHKLSA